MSAGLALLLLTVLFFYWQQRRAFQRLAHTQESALRKDGSECDVGVSLSRMVTDEGQFFAIALRDITERKRTEKFVAFRARTLELLASRTPLTSQLEALVRGIEQIDPSMLCSVLLLSTDGQRLGRGIAPMAMYRTKDGRRNAVAQKQFVLHYQAQVEGAGQVTGAEVLLRWHHPARGMVSPADFIPLAEETGVILALGQWVLETFCLQLESWGRVPGMAHLTLAVNVSALQFAQSEFVEQVMAVVQRSGANPQRLKLELTERLLIGNVAEIIKKWRR